MPNLKEEIISEVKKRFIWFVYPSEIDSPGAKPTAYFKKDSDPQELIDFLSSKLDEIEKEIMGLLPENVRDETTLITEEERKVSIEIFGDVFTSNMLVHIKVGYNSAIQTIREKLINYFKI